MQSVCACVGGVVLHTHCMQSAPHVPSVQCPRATDAVCKGCTCSAQLTGCARSAVHARVGTARTSAHCMHAAHAVSVRSACSAFVLSAHSACSEHTHRACSTCCAVHSVHTGVQQVQCQCVQHVQHIQRVPCMPRVCVRCPVHSMLRAHTVHVQCLHCTMWAVPLYAVCVTRAACSQGLRALPKAFAACSEHAACVCNVCTVCSSCVHSTYKACSACTGAVCAVCAVHSIASVLHVQCMQ